MVNPGLRFFVGGATARKAADSIYQEGVRRSQFCQTDQTAGGYMTESDLLRRTAECAMQWGAGFPEALASVLCMQDARPCRQEKSLASASTHKDRAFAGVAANMRGFFESRQGREGQDAKAQDAKGHDARAV